MASAPPALPHWDLAVIYPALESPQFRADFQRIGEAISDLTGRFDTWRIGRRDPAPLDQETVDVFEDLLVAFNALRERAVTLGAYVHAFVATDSRDDAAQSALGEVQLQRVGLAQLSTRLVAWIGSLDIEALVARSPQAEEHAFALRQAGREAAHQMSPGEEELANELSPSGGSAWSRLHGDLTSQLLVTFDAGDGPARLPMSSIRNLASDPDRDTRRRAYEAELAAWEANALPLAAALNGIKGEVNTLCARRGWDSPLDEALFLNHIDRPTLEAMLIAARESFPDFRRYLRAKARALGTPTLAWYDLFAPLGSSGAGWPYEEGIQFVAEQFGGFSPRLRSLALRADRERWIDAEPRPGKRDGAFCMPLRGEQSRILANYTPGFRAVSTLAHELGHAYHNLNLAGRTPMQRDTPMTLAETASTFCETIIQQAGLARAEGQQALALLEAALQNHCQIVVDITSRFLFESRVFEARRQRQLSIEDFRRLMLESQRETYGDGLDATTLHPYAWAVKGHYYRTNTSFYNFPYMFGLLFGLGLYARYRRQPDGFPERYESLLADTGLADAATLAARFDIDLREPDFWRASLDVIRANIDRFEALVS